MSRKMMSKLPKLIHRVLTLSLSGLTLVQWRKQNTTDAETRVQIQDLQDKMHDKMHAMQKDVGVAIGISETYQETWRLMNDEMHRLQRANDKLNRQIHALKKN